MFSERFDSPVSNVITFSLGPDTPTQEWPAESPYRFPVGPAAPVSDIPQVVLNTSFTLRALRRQYDSVEDRNPSISSSETPRNPF